MACIAIERPDSNIEKSCANVKGPLICKTSANYWYINKKSCSL